MTAFGVTGRCVTLDRLIHLKRSAGRVRDFDAASRLPGRQFSAPELNNVDPKGAQVNVGDLLTVGFVIAWSICCRRLAAALYLTLALRFARIQTRCGTDFKRQRPRDSAA